MFEELEAVLENLGEQGLRYDNDEDFDTWRPETSMEDTSS